MNLPTAFRFARLIDGTGSPPLSEGILRLTPDGFIRSVEVGPPAGGAGDGSVDVTGGGRWTILPGLVDAHDHLCYDVGDEEAQARAHHAMLALIGARNARKVLAAGITTLRDLGEPGGIDRVLQEAIARDLIPGPAVLRSGNCLTPTGGHSWWDCIEVDGPDQVRAAVRRLCRDGVDCIKLMISGGISTPGSEPTQAEFTDVEVAAAIEAAHRKGRRVAAHLHGGPALGPAVAAGLDSVEHGVYLTRADLDRMAEAGTALVVTYGVTVAGAASPDVPASVIDKYRRAADRYLETIAEALRAGVLIALGCDQNHGRLADEIRALLTAGATPLAAIRAATLNGATVCGVASATGSLEPGKRADFIAVEGNPLEDPGAFDRVRLVVKAGRPVAWNGRCLEPGEGWPA